MRVDELWIGVAGIVVTLVSVVLGWGLSTLTRWVQEGSRTRKRNEAVRLLLRTEIDANLENLKDHRAGYMRNKEHYEQYDWLEEQMITELARDITVEKTLTSGFMIWENQLHAVAFALDTDELAQIYDFYSRLYNFITLLSVFQDLGDDIRREYDSMKPNDEFYSSPYTILIQKYEMQLDELVEFENPLR